METKETVAHKDTVRLARAADNARLIAWLVNQLTPADLKNAVAGIRSKVA